MRLSTLALGAGLAASLVVVACSDALHLDPPGGSTSAAATGAGGSTATTAAATTSASTTATTSAATTTTTSSSSSTGGRGGGGGATGGGGSTGSGGGCVSNAECPYPTPVCDTARRVCVECLEFTDCVGKPGTVCSLGACACPDATASYCAADAVNGTARCVDQSSDPADCGACSHTCFGMCGGSQCLGAWDTTSTIGAPTARVFHTAVWTGSVMIVWGGFDDGGAPLATGAMYDPSTLTWTATSVVNAPEARGNHTATWDDVDNVMLVFGGTGAGGELATGAAFDPVTNTWTPLPTSARATARTLHSAVWTGSTMVIWGGEAAGNQLATGAIYTPTSKVWTATAKPSAPSPRSKHSAVYLGGKMIVWGGFGPPTLGDTPVALGDGGIYDLGTSTWTATSTTSAPSARYSQTAVVGGGSMLLFGGTDGSSYFADGFAFTTTWTPFTGSEGDARALHTAVITGTGATEEMLVFGGTSGSNSYLNTGARLSTAADHWTAALDTAPTGRNGHSAVSTGSKMIIWGGYASPSGAVTNTGAIFDPSATP